MPFLKYFVYGSIKENDDWLFVRGIHRSQNTLRYHGCKIAPVPASEVNLYDTGDSLQ